MSMDSFVLLDIGLLAFMLAVAVAVVRVNNLLMATVLLAIFSLLMATIYLVLGAPDVAITEAAIGAGISTLLLLAALLLTGEDANPVKHKLLPLLVVVGIAALLIYAVSGLPALGDAGTVANHHVAAYYLENSMRETGVPNVVTSVLASYRGYDTLGETFVIFTAGIAVLLLLGKQKSS